MKCWVSSQVAATDEDTVGSVVYGLSSTQPFFTVHPVSGLVSSRVQLDREAGDHYNMTVSAFDGIQTALALLVVRVLDVNDNDPVFSRRVHFHFTLRCCVRSSQEYCSIDSWLPISETMRENEVLSPIGTLSCNHQNTTQQEADFPWK